MHAFVFVVLALVVLNAATWAYFAGIPRSASTTERFGVSGPFVAGIWMLPAFGLLALRGGVEGWVSAGVVVAAVAMIVYGLYARRKLRAAHAAKS